MTTTTVRQRAAPAPMLFSDPTPWTRVLQVWLAAGLAALVAFPTLRGINDLFGWLPFWLIVAPALDLAVLRRAVLAQSARSWLKRLERRRRHPATALVRRRPRSRRGPRAAARAVSPA